MKVTHSETRWNLRYTWLAEIDIFTGMGEILIKDMYWAQYYQTLIGEVLHRKIPLISVW